MNSLHFRRFLSAAALFAAALPAFAAVKMSSIFGDHMVLQQGLGLPVWGIADAGEKVTVTLGNESSSTVANAEGKWSLKLAPLPTGAPPLAMTVAGTNTLEFKDILIGDVWLCGGQSNMQFNLSGAADAATEIPKANDPQLRIFLVGLATALDPQAELPGHWELCTPDSIKRFSAVGYFFGRDLRRSRNYPIGLIGSYWGGTPARAWLSLSALEKEPSLAHYVKQADQIRSQYPSALSQYPAKLAAYQAGKADWDKNVAPVYNAELQKWNEASAAAKAAGQPAPPMPTPSVPMPRQPSTADGGPGRPSNLFNGMIAPLIPYGIKGVIWYQGESNQSAPQEYQTLFADVIDDWRTRWDEGNFPFLFVQLAAFQAGGPSWNILREAQAKTLALPHTGMASALDIGNPANVHPKDKIDVGHRLAFIANVVAYGQPGPRSGPIYDKIEALNGFLRVSFTQIGSGLIVGTAPWTAPGVSPLPAGKLVGFVIAGEDRKWVTADAHIDGNTVLVSSPQVPHPLAVRYAWEPAPRCNLYNREFFPASPFRSDNWPDGAATTPVPAQKHFGMSQ